MKTTICAFILSFSLINGYSQEPTTNKEPFKNEAGIMLTDLINGAYHLKYERYLGKHFSVSLGVGYKGEDGLIRLSGLNRDRITTDRITYSGLKLIPELRYYMKNTQNGYLDGLYFGLYVKNLNFTSDVDGTYISSSNNTYIIDFEAKLRITSVGLMVGYKWAFSKRFALDFLIAGPGSAFHSYTLDNRQPLPDEFYDDLNETLDEYSIFDLINADFRFRADKRRTRFSIFSFRYGISLGYSF